MKIFNSLKACLAMLTCSIAFSSCYIGGGTITFDSNGAGYDPQPVSLNNGQTLDPLPVMSKIGYDFVGWCYDEDLIRLAYAPVAMGIHDFTLYAKYKINDSYFIYEDAMNWTENSPTYSFVRDTPCYILLNMLPTLPDLKNITIQAFENSDYRCMSMKVFDYNGKEIPDKNPAPEIFEPDIDLQDTPLDMKLYRQYVLVIQPQVNGTGMAQITCYV